MEKFKKKKIVLEKTNSARNAALRALLHAQYILTVFIDRDIY